MGGVAYSLYSQRIKAAFKACVGVSGVSQLVGKREGSYCFEDDVRQFHTAFAACIQLYTAS